MDERSQHGYQQQQSPHQPPQQQQAGAAPWPHQQAQPYGAPIHGYAPYPGPAVQHAPVQPSMQQFQYAAQGYVLPGAHAGQDAPLAAHGGMIGMPQAGVPQPAIDLHGMMAQPMMSHPQHASAFHAHDNGAPQAWAFPTPHGLQLVQPGAAAEMAPAPAGQHGLHASASARRLRWETIVPAAAVLCLLAAIALFLSDFDRMTGRDVQTAASSETTAQVDAEPAEEPASAADPLADAGADTATKPAASGGASPRAKRVDALLTRLASERRAKRWTAVITTIGQIEQLQGLSPELRGLRTRARAASKAAKARAARDAARRQQQQASPSTQGGGSHTGHKMPPAAGGNAGASTGARPPATVGKNDIPAVPNVPNPTSGGGGVMSGGQAAGDGGGECHTHDGVYECH